MDKARITNETNAMAWFVRQ